MIFWYDHLLIFISMILFPVVGFVSYRSNIEKLRQGKDLSRVGIYLSTISIQWILAILCFFLWWFTERSWAKLGLSSHFDSTWWIAAIITALVIVLFFIQSMSVSKLNDETSKKIFDQAQHELAFMPTNARETKYFNLLSLTAGIVEEILWRGLLVWYLSYFVDHWQALLISLIAFTLAHSYQGFSQLYKVGLLGALLTAVMWLSGNLWLAIILHIAIDILLGSFFSKITLKHSKHELSATNS